MTVNKFQGPHSPQVMKVLVAPQDGFPWIGVTCDDENDDEDDDGVLDEDFYEDHGNGDPEVGGSVRISIRISTGE